MPCHCPQGATPYKPLAERVREFSKTPARFKSKPAPAEHFKRLCMTMPKVRGTVHGRKARCLGGPGVMLCCAMLLPRLPPAARAQGPLHTCVPCACAPAAQEPCLRTTSRLRPSHFKPHEEEEAEAMAAMPQFHARPLK